MEYAYLSQTPEWHFYGREDFPSHEDIMAARDNIMEKHPDLIVIGAHLGSLSHDVGEIARRLDKYPNFYVEPAERTKQLTRQPARKVREFFIKYQDRIMYGTDVRFGKYIRPVPEEEYDDLVKRTEEYYRRDYQYYAGSGTVEYFGKEVDCLHLPAEVLEKSYWQNAEQVVLNKY